MQSRVGRYEIVEKIASGGMATVFLGRLAKEGGFERLVALKVMHPHIAGDPQFVAMFLDEARLAAQIHHPNVVSTLDIEKSEESLVLVMDFVDGPSLHELGERLAASGERIPMRIVLRIFLDVLNGLQAAHDLSDARGKPLHLVHRDVSPQNILVGRDGVARLTDFGVARAESRLSTTRGDQVKGNLPYLPPEQIADDCVTRQSDLHALGVSLWEAIVGQRLFEGDSAGHIVHQILHSERERPSSLVPCQAAIERVVMRAIARDPSERYGEAVEMAEALERAARESGIRISKAIEVGRLISDQFGEGLAATVRLPKAELVEAPEPLAEERAGKDEPVEEARDEEDDEPVEEARDEEDDEPVEEARDEEDDEAEAAAGGDSDYPEDTHGGDDESDLDEARFDARDDEGIDGPHADDEEALASGGVVRRKPPYLFVTAIVALLAGASAAVLLESRRDARPSDPARPAHTAPVAEGVTPPPPTTSPPRVEEVATPPPEDPAARAPMPRPDGPIPTRASPPAVEATAAAPASVDPPPSSAPAEPKESIDDSRSDYGF